MLQVQLLVSLDRLTHSVPSTKHETRERNPQELFTKFGRRV